jgi:hypothetical protein
MAEIDLSALAQHCLNRRIGARETFTQETTVWSSQRHKARQTGRWTVTTREARRNLTHKYPHGAGLI